MSKPILNINNYKILHHCISGQYFEVIKKLLTKAQSNLDLVHNVVLKSNKLDYMVLRRIYFYLNHAHIFTYDKDNRFLRSEYIIFAHALKATHLLMNWVSANWHYQNIYNLNKLNDAKYIKPFLQKTYVQLQCDLADLTLYNDMAIRISYNQSTDISNRNSLKQQKQYVEINALKKKNEQ